MNAVTTHLRSETAQVTGISAEYEVSDVAVSYAGIMVKISKEQLQTLRAK